MKYQVLFSLRNIKINFRMSSATKLLSALIRSTLQTNIDTFANRVDPDETALLTLNEPSHRDLHCLSAWYWVLTQNPIYNNGCVQLQGWMTPLKNCRDERVKGQFCVRNCVIFIIITIIIIIIIIANTLPSITLFSRILDSTDFVIYSLSADIIHEQEIISK